MNRTSVAQPAKTTSFLPPTQGILQRKCACEGSPGMTGECAACSKKRQGNLQRSAVSNESTNGVPPIVHDVLRSPGQPLDAATRSFMEPRFGHDFSKVRVHTGVKAADSARAVNALAYTVGQEIVLDEAFYSPNSEQGMFLLAHELAHTVQQSSTCDSP